MMPFIHRMLIGHYNALHTPEEGMVGIIEQQCCPGSIAAQAAEDAAGLADYYYGTTPEVRSSHLCTTASSTELLHEPPC